MDRKIFIYIGLALLFFWLTSPVPYCKITEKQISVGDALYTASEVSVATDIYLTLLNVRGESMLPTIQDNSECLCIKKDNYEIRDIVFFFAKVNDEFMGISHRVVSVNDEQVFTKGDNNDWVDPPMTKESIVCAIPTVPRYYLLW